MEAHLPVEHSPGNLPLRKDSLMTAFPRKSLLRLPRRHFLATKPRCLPILIQNSLAKQETSRAEELGWREVGCRWMNHRSTKEAGVPTVAERVSQ